GGAPFGAAELAGAPVERSHVPGLAGKVGLRDSPPGPNTQSNLRNAVLSRTKPTLTSCVQSHRRQYPFEHHLLHNYHGIFPRNATGRGRRVMFSSPASSNQA